MKKIKHRKNEDSNILYICGRDTVLENQQGSITIRDMKPHRIFNIFTIFIILIILILIPFFSIGIFVTYINLFEVPGWAMVFLLISMSGVALACKILIWLQALLFGFNLSLSKYFIKGRWGIIPIRRTIKSDAEIVLSLVYMRGAWGCGGKIKSCRKDIFPCSLFLPYVVSSKKSVALRELDIISNWLANNLSTVKIVVKKGN